MSIVSNLVPSGVIFPFSGSVVPNGWVFCNGQELNRTDYQELYNAIGTSYGYGNNSTTFNVPDLRYAFIRGYGAQISVTGSGTASSNNATFTNHGITRTGMIVRKSSGTLSGLSASTDYYAIVVNSTTLAFASSYANAIAGTKIAISGVNSAVIVQWEDPDISSRLQAAVGGNASGLGTRQDDQYKSHNHSGTISSNWGAGGSANVNGGDGGGIPFTASVSIGSSGGNENRSKNIYMNYIIKV